MYNLKRTLLTTVILLMAYTGLAQDYTRHNWFFAGNDQGILFGKDAEANSIIFDGKNPQTNNGEKVTATDAITGDLIFYSDGLNIYDGTYQVMPNGNNIQTDPNGIQALATSPVPGLNSEDLFYMFHKNASGEILYTIVDRSIQGNRAPEGLPSGDVITSRKNQSTGIANRGDGMITIGSEDMTTFWLITQNLADSTIQIHEIPPAGGAFISVGTINLTNPIIVQHMAYHQLTGQIALLPSNNSNIEIIQFTNGFSGPSLNSVRTILNSFVFGEDFGGSPGWSYTGQFLYFSRNTTTNGNVFRSDVFDTNLSASIEQVLSTPVTESLSLQLAPDSTVYHIYRNAAGGDRLLARIDRTDSLDVAELLYEPELFESADVSSDYFTQFGPMAPIQPDIEIEVGNGPFCMNNPVQFFPAFDPSTAIPDNYFWDFQPFGVTSDLQSPVVTFDQAGVLTASLFVEINGRTYPASNNPFVREITENDIQVSLPDTTICEGETLTLDAEPQNGGQGQQGGASGGPYTYLWSTGETTSTIDVTETGDYWVVITPNTGCPIYATARVQVYADESTTANIWYFGFGAGLDFNEVEGLDPPPRSIIDPHAMDAPEGTSTISDANGDVLFYSNGSTVWNRENTVMPNGTDIGGDSTSTQSVIILPFIEDETLYYIFTTEEVYGTNTYELKYTLVDMKEDNGRGDVLLKDVVLFSKSTEKIAAYEGGNGYWLLTHEYGNNTFRAYPITEEGIGSPVLSSAGGIHSFNDPLSGQAGMKFSQAGDRLAVAIIEDTEDYVEVFDFDPEIGEIIEFNYRIDLNEGGPGNDEVYDVHFSTGGRKLYATLNNRNTGSAGGRILEYRVDTFSTETTRLNSRADITAGAGLSVNYGQIQTGPNGALYVAVETPGNQAGSTFVSQINPNEDTLSFSGFTPQAVQLTTGNSRLGLPNFVQNNSNPQDEPTISADSIVCVETRVGLSGSGTSDIDEYQWTITNQADNSTVFSVAAQDTAYTFTADQEGRYNISFNITNRCGLDTTLVQEIQVFGIPEPPTVPGAVSVCEDSEFALEAGPADPNLAYEWTNSQGAVVSTDRTYSITEPEIYTVTITNIIAGCTNSAQIFAGPPFDISLPDASTICEGSELTLDPNVTANNYIWTVIDEGGNVSPPLANQRRATVDSSVPGIFRYVVSIEDPISAGCFVNDTTTVTINAIPRGIASAIVNPACGATDGSFNFDVSTTGSYTYTITGNSSGVVDQSSNFIGPGTIPLSSLAADVYTVQLTDNSSGCVNAIGDIQVQNDPPDFTMTTVATAATDCGVNDGSILVTLSADVFPIRYTLTNTTDGTTTGPIDVASAIPTTTFDFNITGLGLGNFDLEVSSVGSGCIQTATGIAVDQPQPVQLTVEPFLEDCAANIQLSASSTTVGASYSWTGPNGFTSSVQNPVVTASGSYTVTASAPNGCPTSADVVVDLTIQPIVQINQVGDVCNGEITLEAEVTNPETGADYTFNWSNGANSRSITVDASGTFTVTARNSVNLTCEGTASTNITIPTPIEATISSTPACDDGSPVTLTVNVTAGSPSSITWTGPGGFTATGTSVSVNDEGSYIATITDGTCPIERGIDIRRQSIPEGELPDVDFYCPTRTSNPILFAGSGFVTYEWTLDGVAFPDADQTLTVQQPGEYVVTMTTAIGCVQTDTVTIIESCDPSIVAPNAFAPSSPAPNNTFSVVPNDFVNDFEIYIYSRWGELLFTSSTLEFKWDGKVNGQLVPVGTYPYIIKFTSRFEPERGTFEQRGSVTVIR